MKYQLTEYEIKLMQRISKIIGKVEIDDDGYIKIDELIGVVYDLEDKYDEIYDKLVEYDERAQETWREHFINEQIDRGLHPHEYE